MDRFFSGEVDTGPFGMSDFSLFLALLIALANSAASSMGTTSAISSGLRLSSEGALSDPTELVVSPSV